jgi:hypothetical protein
MSKSLECPRCHLQVDNRVGLGRESRRCRTCGTALVLTSRPSEADVRKYLYGHRLTPLPRRARDPTERIVN